MLRRYAPWLLVVAIAGAVVLPPFGVLALIPLYGIARYRRLRLAVAGAVALTLVTFVDSTELPARLGSATVLSAVAVYVGVTVRSRREAAARERALLEDRAATEERLRIARELHDAVGHDVSLMVVQAQAVAAVTGDERVEAIADLGRRTMAELHRTLLVLRDDASHAPQPGLDSLSDVLDGARAAGVPITYTVEGAPRALPAGLDATAYRIVQEAVTNVIRHAGGAAATVTVRYGRDELELVVGDEGESAGGRDGGHGLIGMRERVAAFGGTLAAGPRTHRGFEVHARLPYA